MAYKLLSDFDKNKISTNEDYNSFSKFGSSINNQVESPFNASNPLTYSMFPGMGNQFQHGSSVSSMLNTTYNPSAETFMSQRCSTKWDGFCNAYHILNVDTYWPNSAVIDSVAYNMAQGFLKNNRPTVGEILIRNSVNRKFLSFPFETPNVEQFDPNTANSPEIKIYSNYINSPSYVNDLKKINIDEDEHIELMLEYPTPCFDVLVRLYLAYIRKEPSYEKILKTKLEKFFQKNREMIETFLNDNFSKIPSYHLKSNQNLQ